MEGMVMMQEWFKDARFGISLHWGIYAVNGTTESWAFFNGDVSYEEYMSQLNGFTASKYDPKAWAELFVKAGAKYAVLTTKHHDGLALWDTKVSDFSVVHQTPAKRDLVGPFCEAVREAGLKVGLYFSHLDWTEPTYRSVYGNPAIKTRQEYIDHLNQQNADKFSWQAEQDIRPYNIPANGDEDKETWEKFKAFHRAQLTELATNYGKIDMWTFDGHWERTAEQWGAEDLNVMLRRFNPEVIMNNRLHNHGDYDQPEQAIPITPPDRDWECWFCVNESWGYRPIDQKYKSTRQIIKMFADCMGMGGNVMINVAPLEDGTIDPVQEQRLLEFGEWMIPNSEAVYGTTPGLPIGLFNGASTLSKDRKTLYLFYFDRPLEAIPVKGIFNDIKRISILKTGKELTHKKIGGMDVWNTTGIYWIDLPDEDVDSMATVIKVELDGELRLYNGSSDIQVDNRWKNAASSKGM